MSAFISLIAPLPQIDAQTFSFLFIIAPPKCERCLNASYTLICTRQTLMNAPAMNVAWLGELAHAYWTMSKVRGTWLIILYSNWEESIPLFAGVEQAEHHFNLRCRTPWDGFDLKLVGCFQRKRREQTQKQMMQYMICWEYIILIGIYTAVSRQLPLLK